MEFDEQPKKSFLKFLKKYDIIYIQSKGKHKKLVSLWEHIDYHIGMWRWD